MGLGKTLQTLSLLAYLNENHGIKGPHLLICPLSVLGAWMTVRWLAYSFSKLRSVLMTFLLAGNHSLASIFRALSLPSLPSFQ